MRRALATGLPCLQVIGGHGDQQNFGLGYPIAILDLEWCVFVGKLLMRRRWPAPTATDGMAPPLASPYYGVEYGEIMWSKPPLTRHEPELIRNSDSTGVGTDNSFGGLTASEGARTTRAGSQRHA
uniref:Uncharacterized protein n=1 Tax=Coccidioides posadasii RMSCC 3488 TaxID=454284 RepID=A0A0J6FJ87_COCPO|nr:hypothetical protein CPAG_05785 [Coccidioides posadasii RMSCC 3488]